MRDMDTKPYTAEEERVSRYIQTVVDGQMGSGDDPIGFLIASHAALAQGMREARDSVSRLIEKTEEMMKFIESSAGPEASPG